MRKTILLILAVLSLAPSSLTAQDYQVPAIAVSKDKIRKNGALYYAHVVTPRQTLFSISKAYGVTIQDIYDANPEMNLEKEGLRNGAVLFIPEVSAYPKGTADTASVNPAVDAKEIEKAEAAERAKAAEAAKAAEKAKAAEAAKAAEIAKAAEKAEAAERAKAAEAAKAAEKAKAAEAAKAAEEAKAAERAKAAEAREAKVSETLNNISAALSEAAQNTAALFRKNSDSKQEESSKAEEAAAEPAAGPVSEGSNEYFVHTVKWYEDLSAIAQRYDMPKEVIMAYNGLKEAKVEKRQELRIPLHPEKVEIPKDVAIVAGSAQKHEEPQGGKPQSDSTSLGSRIGSMVESIGDKIEDIFADNSPVNEVSVSLVLPFSNKGTINDSNYDFYSGVLLATKDLAAEGISVDLSVFDATKGLSAIAQRLKASDLILGPVSKDAIDSVITLTAGIKPVISPLDPRVESMVADHQSLVQAPSSAKAQFDDIISWIREDYIPGDRIILIKEDKGKVSGIADCMEDLGIEYSTVSYGILQSSNIANKIQSLVSPTGTTRFVIASDSEAFVNDAVRNVNLMAHRKYNVVLYAPAKIRNFETIEVENLHNANLHLSSTYFVDYDSARIRNFLMRYRALCKAEPSPFAYQGYDTAYFFIKSHANSPRLWRDNIKQVRYKGLQSDFLFEGTEDGGIINKAVRRSVYNPDFSIQTL